MLGPLRRERSRSPLRLIALSEEEQEAMLVEFAEHYWLPCEGHEPWEGPRAKKVLHYRLKLLAEIEQLIGMDLDDPSCSSSPLRWQRFVFLDDLARMSDILFRGPIEPRHADETDLRLHQAWRVLRYRIADLSEFAALTMDFRVSAVRVAMMLETGRPPGASTCDTQFQLPDARSLSCLLCLRCDKDSPEELAELERLLCQKLQGTSCSHCHQSFEESCGIFDGEQFTIPVTVPKVFVAPCGHAIHTLCLGSQIIPEPSENRGCCRLCRKPYSWTYLDVDPLINAFCLMFGPYVDKRSQDMQAALELSSAAITSIAEVCSNFSLETNGLLSAASAWALLLRRHIFREPDMVKLIGEEVLRSLSLPEGEELEVPALVPAAPSEIEPELEPEVDELPPVVSEEALDPWLSPDESFSEEELLDPSMVMLTQLVEGCDGDRSMNGLLPSTDGSSAC